MDYRLRLKRAGRVRPRRPRVGDGVVFWKGIRVGVAGGVLGAVGLTIGSNQVESCWTESSLAFEQIVT